MAYLSEGVGGWHISDNANDYIDERGFAFPNKSSALAILRWTLRMDKAGWTERPAYTHYRTGKTKIRKL